MGKKKCRGCAKKVSQTAGVKCFGCSCYYHHFCVLLDQEDEVPESWRCLDCELRMHQKNLEPAVPESAGSAAVDSSAILAAAADCPVFVPAAIATAATPISAEQDDAISIPSSPDIDIPVVSARPALDQIHRELRSTKDDLMLARDEVDQVSTSYNERIDNLEIRMESMINWINVLEEERIDKDVKLEVVISQLRQEINELDQNFLANDIDITGIPEEMGEDIIQMVLTIAKKLAVPLELNEIVHAERVGNKRPPLEDGKPPKPRPIAVRLVRRACRDALLREARLRRDNTTADLDMEAPIKKYYINERLTKTNRALFHKAKEISERKKWKYLWIRDGRIYARKEHGNQKHRIRTEMDIRNVYDVQIDSE